MKKKYWIYVLILVLLITGAGTYYYFYHYLAKETRRSFLQLDNDFKKTDTDLKGNTNGGELKKGIGHNNGDKSRTVVNHNNYDDRKDHNDNSIVNINNKEYIGNKEMVNQIKEEKDVITYNLEGEEPVSLEIASEEEKRSGFRNPFKDFRQNNKKSLESVQVSALIDSGKAGIHSQDGKKITIDKLKSILPFKLTGIIGSEDKRLAVIQDIDGSRIMHNGDYIGDFRVLNIKKESIIFLFKDLIFELGLRSDTGEG